MGRRLIFAGLAGLLLVSAVGVFGTQNSGKIREFVETREGELTAELLDEPDWCKPDMTFTIRGKDDVYFTEGEECKAGESCKEGTRGLFLLQKLLAGVRVGLQKECPQAKSITFNGFVDDVFVYRGYASKDNPNGEWVLFDLPVNLVESPPVPPPVSTPIEAPPRPESIAECNEFAAHPDDPTKPKGIKGVADDDVEAGKALFACEDALELEPDNTRLKFQLARAFLLYDKPAEGVGLMTEAAEEGHGAAIAALGDFALYGLLDDEPDPEMAKALYLKAAKAGFKPATKLAAAIIADPKEDKSQEVAGEPEYQQPKRLAQLKKGEIFPEQGAAFVYAMTYGSAVLAGIKHHCPEVDAALSLGQIQNAVFKRTDFMTVMMIGSDDELKQAGMDDGYALAFDKGCKSQEVQAVQESMRKTFN
jgi:hypothetical protein